MAIEFPPIETLVFHRENYKVVSIFKAPASTWVDKKLELQEAEIALVMPVEPGKGDFTKGFQMILARVNNGKISSLAADVMSLCHYGKLGFEASGTGFINIFLDDERVLAEYKVMGWGPSITKLKESVKKNNILIINNNPSQEDYETAAKDISPSLMRFFNLEP